MSGSGLFGGESVATVAAFRKQTGVTFPLLLGDDTRRSYGRGVESISPFPFDVVVDKKGFIRHLSTRFDSTTIERMIEALIAE